MLDTMYEMPSMLSVREVIIDKAVVEGKKQPIVLHMSEQQPDIKRKAS